MPAIRKMKTALVLALFYLVSMAPALTGLPMKVTVQTGDTLCFTPFVRSWNITDLNITVTLSTPAHGTVQLIPSFFDTNRSFIYLDTVTSHVRKQCPKGFPGFRYIPNAGFTGKDSFTYTIRNSTDSTTPTPCVVRVTPPEPGNMTVLLIVNTLLLPSIQAEVDRLKTDLQNEGYSAKIIPFPDLTAANKVNAKRLWDTLTAQYDAPSQVVAGAILIGRLPYYSFGSVTSKESAFWCMSLWEADADADTALIGYRTGYSAAYKGDYHTPGFPNIWVSRMYGAVGTFGTEAELTKRILQANHDYRTGISRLPHTAFQFIKTNVMTMPWLDYRKLLEVWPEAFRRTSPDTAHPFTWEFRRGGELWDISIDGSSDYYNASSSGVPNWRYTGTEIFNTLFPIRFLLSNSCHTGGYGNLVNRHLLVKNGGCVLAVGPTDYCTGCPQYSFTDTSRSQNRIRMRALLARGDRFGRAWIRCNHSLYSTVWYGDLSLKPKMTPPNRKPVISAVSAVKGAGMSWTFTVTASDADDAITGYDWYANSYGLGRANPDSSGPAKSTLSYTYASAKTCTLRVEVVDAYKAREYAEVILKTDSGVISTRIATDLEATQGPRDKAPLRVHPNPFNPATTITFNVARRSNVRAHVMDPAGRTIRTLLDQIKPAGEHRVQWDGKNGQGRPVSSGTYYLCLTVNSKRMSKPLLLMK